MLVELATFHSYLRGPPAGAMVEGQILPCRSGQGGCAAGCTELTSCPTWQAMQVWGGDVSPLVPPSRAEQGALIHSNM